MTPVNASDLPRHVRARLPQPPPKARREVADAAPVSERRCRWRCFYCPVTSDRWAPMERHANDTGHARVEIVWGEGEG